MIFSLACECWSYVVLQRRGIAVYGQFPLELFCWKSWKLLRLGATAYFRTHRLPTSNQQRQFYWAEIRGDGPSRRLLQNALSAKAVITPGSLAAAHVRASAGDLEVNYLPRWAKVVDGGVKDEFLEQCARCVVSHLLNRGHSADQVTHVIRKAMFAGAASAGDLIRELETLASVEPMMFRAVFPVISAPMTQQTTLDGWMLGAVLAEWIKAQKAKKRDDKDRFIGAVAFDVHARDHVSAAEKATAGFALICNRAALGTRKPIRPLGYFWLSGRTDFFPIEPITRGVEVASIGRQDQVYLSADGMAGIDRAIALLAELDHGPLSAAVTSGWAAMESLAMGPAEDDNRVETAIRIASLVTASFPRAELTTLAYSYVKSHKDQLADELRAATSNRERAEKMMRRLAVAPLPTFNRAEDIIAAKRMLLLMVEPVNTIRRINQHIEMVMKRLYRLRNLVAHGGRTDSIVLEPAARTAAPLIGAAFDRIHHASVSQKLSPVELIARAQLRIACLDASQPLQLTTLLE